MFQEVGVFSICPSPRISGEQRPYIGLRGGGGGQVHAPEGGLQPGVAEASGVAVGADRVEPRGRRQGQRGGFTHTHTHTHSPGGSVMTF